MYLEVGSFFYLDTNENCKQLRVAAPAI